VLGVLGAWNYSDLNGGEDLTQAALIVGLAFGSILGSVLCYAWTRRRCLSLVALLVYLLSCGPANMLLGRIPNIQVFARVVYAPVVLAHDIPMLERPIEAYLEMWQHLGQRLRDPFGNDEALFEPPHAQEE
jgi:hypothetical protein